MNASLDNILGQFTDSIKAEVAAANDRARLSESRFEKLIEGLSVLVGQCSSNDNESNAEPIESDNPQLETKRTKRPPRTKSYRLDDIHFLDALTTEWITAGKLRHLLISRGITIAEGTIYNRMRKLSFERPHEIEAAAKPERWRLRTTRKVREPSIARTETKGKDAKRRGQRLSLVPSGQASSASATAEIHRPVLHHGDCLEVMKTLPDDSVDLILADLPYGTTRISIDKPLPLDELWSEYRRILRKPHGNIVLFGSQPFTTALINAAPDLFKYSLVWMKNSAVGFQHAGSKPLKKHEDILVFSYGTNITAKRSKRCATFNDQDAVPTPRTAKGRVKVRYLDNAFSGHRAGREYMGLSNCQTSILNFAKDSAKAGKKCHPFAKPIALLERLIRTYSHPGEVVLDNTMGSGSTCVAAMRSGRRSIGVEQDQEWFDVAVERIESVNDDLRLADAVEPIQPISVSAEHTIYQGDCLDVMKSMPSGSVDLVVTSPPYNLALSQRSGMKKSKACSLWHNAKLADGYASYDDAMPHEEYVAWMRRTLSECWRLLSDDGAIFMNHKPRIQKKELWTPLDLNPSLPLRQIVIWDRGNGFNFNPSFFTPSHEWIMIFAKPAFRFKHGKKLNDVWSFPHARNNDHPAPFPLQLPLNAIEHTNAQVVLDPFMGSGTTGVAAQRLGRKFIGIELDPQYAADAVARIEADKLDLAA